MAFRGTLARVQWGGVVPGVCFFMLLLVEGCANAPRPSHVGSTPVSTPPALYRGGLTDYVTAAGLRWLIVGRPSYLAHHASLRALRDRWLTAERFRAFATATGIDLTRTEHALAAGFDLGTLYMADASGWVEDPERPFLERLAGSATVHRPHPMIWRITGLAGSIPQVLVRVDRDLVAISVGDPTPARAVELRARGRLERVAKALQGAALSGLPPELMVSHPLQLYALGPFEGEWLSDGRGLLVGARAAAMAVDLDADRLELRIALLGYWDPVLDRERLLTCWDAVAASPLGRRLGLDQPSQPIVLEASESELTLGAGLDASTVFEGLQALLAGDLEEILNEPGPPFTQMPH